MPGSRSRAGALAASRSCEHWSPTTWERCDAVPPPLFCVGSAAILLIVTSAPLPAICEIADAPPTAAIAALVRGRFCPEGAVDEPG